MELIVGMQQLEGISTTGIIISRTIVQYCFVYRVKRGFTLQEHLVFFHENQNRT